MTIKTHAGFQMRPEAVVVLRIPPSHNRFASALECIEGLVKKGYAVWVFLHGPAVGPWLNTLPDPFRRLVEDDAISVQVCQAAWHRLGVTGDPAHPTSSLIQMWQHILKAQVVEVFGLGDWPDGWPLPMVPLKPCGYGMMIAYEASVWDGSSQLEWVLAGSAMELDLVVAFADPRLLQSQEVMHVGWAQLVDHALASVVTDAKGLPSDDRLWMVL